ncbi:MAG: hypothetical protein KC416_00265 [Myxococcales bacterium]|nr:hypothetical protein [Myxococcales bacterium]
MVSLPENVRAELATLRLSVVPPTATGLLRAAHWQRTLVRFGLAVPFFVIHDLGTVLLAEVSVHRPKEEGHGSHHAYAALVAEIAGSEVCLRARTLRLSDHLIAALLIRVLRNLSLRSGYGSASGMPPEMPLDASLYGNLSGETAELPPPGETAIAFLRAIEAHALQVLLSVEQVDLDTLRLVGMFGSDLSAPLDVVDMLSLFEAPDAHDIVNFSLDLLPSVLETHRVTGEQSFQIDGFAGLSRTGDLDSIVMSELAHDDELFDLRFAEKELFYFSREKRSGESRGLHHILVDASASMRGTRAVFARGLALTLYKRLSLQGDDVVVRFFDAGLYETMGSPRSPSTTPFSVPAFLSFRGERGRHYAAVFSSLAHELSLGQRGDERIPSIYVMTHSECHIPHEVVDRLTKLARIHGVFLLPSGGSLQLPYLDRLAGYQVVSAESLGKPKERRERAVEILDKRWGEHPGVPP